MTNEKKSKDRDGFAFVVFAVFGATAATAFAIQAWMTYGFGREVWGLPHSLAGSLVFALDIFAIMFMVLSYGLRGRGWPRGVATTIFIFAIGAQVYAAELFGDHKNWPPEIRLFASLPAVLLALSQEGVILWRTHRNEPAPGPGGPAPTKTVPPKTAPAVQPTPGQQAAGAPTRQSRNDATNTRSWSSPTSSRKRP